MNTRNPYRSFGHLKRHAKRLKQLSKRSGGGVPITRQINEGKR